MIRHALRGGLVFFLLFPFLFLLWKFPLGTSLDVGELRWAFFNSFHQAFGSASFSLALGLWGAFGLICLSKSVRPHWRFLAEVLLLLPNFLPPLFVLLATMNLVDPFPMGLPGMILVHTLMNWGLIAVLAARLIESKIGALAEFAWVQGISSFQFIRRVMLPLIWRDLASLWLFVFVVCFSSFSVPLIVGGGRGTTLEVLIYEKIRFTTQWSDAVLIALLQSAFLFFLSWLLIRGEDLAKSEPRNFQLLERRSGLVMSLFLSGLLLLGYLQGFAQGISQLHFFSEMRAEIISGIFGSLLVGLSTGVFCLALLLGMAFLLPSRWLSHFLSGFVAPSSALAAFAFLTVGPNSGLWPLIKVPLILTLIFLPTLWRLGGRALVESLQQQREIAATLGASERKIWNQILLPQLAPALSTLAGLSAVWACGDFAISKVIASRDLTLGMMTESLISSGYRLGLATWMSAGVFGVAVLCYGLLKGVGYVLGRKPLS